MNNIVLVHSAFVDGAHWEAVYKILEARWLQYQRRPESHNITGGRQHVLDDQCRQQAYVGEVPLPHTTGYSKSHGRSCGAVVANNRESNGRDLFEAIERGDSPRCTLFIQVMTEEQAKTHKHNPFDLTKVWPKADYPLIEVGVMELNRYTENYFAEVEQAAFSPANVVPGISFSPDKMLQGRLFSYGDTQRYRLGINFNHIPVNAPQCPFHSYHRDGKMRADGNLGATTSYNPNSQKVWDNQPEYGDLPLTLEGDANHYDHRLEDDHWEQPGNLFRKMIAEQKQLLFDNTARAINGASQEVLDSACCELQKSRSGLWRWSGTSN